MGDFPDPFHPYMKEVIRKSTERCSTERPCALPSRIHLALWGECFVLERDGAVDLAEMETCSCGHARSIHHRGRNVCMHSTDVETWACRCTDFTPIEVAVRDKPPLPQFGIGQGATLPDLTYHEHMRWCKDRALEYVDRGELVNALASIASDVRKHAETNTPAVTMLLATEGVRCVQSDDPRAMRRFIEGFASGPPRASHTEPET